MTLSGIVIGRTLHTDTKLLRQNVPYAGYAAAGVSGWARMVFSWTGPSVTGGTQFWTDSWSLRTPEAPRLCFSKRRLTRSFGRLS